MAEADGLILLFRIQPHIAKSSRNPQQAIFLWAGRGAKNKRQDGRVIFRKMGQACLSGTGQRVSRLNHPTRLFVFVILLLCK
jgi:hypothetical protein